MPVQQPLTPSRSRRRAAVAGVLATTMCASCASLRSAHSVGVNDDRSVRISGIVAQRHLAANYIRFAPRSLTLRPGDGIRFENWSKGEPHAIAFGTAVDEAVRAITALGPNPAPRQVLELPEVKRLPKPFDLPAPGAVPTIDPRAGEPCVIPAGAALDRCASSDTPELDGRRALVGSGLLDEGQVFRIRLARDIAPGEYAFVDLAHPEVAYGRLTVVAAGKDRPTPGDAADRADDELDVVGQALRGVTPLATVASAEKGVAGVASQDGFDHLLTFGTEPYRVPVGGTVSWRLFGMHSITFAPTEEAKRGLTVERDGNVLPNEAAWRPSAAPAITTAPSAEDPLVTEQRIDGGAWDGSGMRNSGVLRAYPPVRATYSLTFSAPGEYRFTCLLHDAMKGTVVVGGGD